MNANQKHSISPPGHKLVDAVIVAEDESKMVIEEVYACGKRRRVAIYTTGADAETHVIIPLATATGGAGHAQREQRQRTRERTAVASVGSTDPPKRWIGPPWKLSELLPEVIDDLARRARGRRIMAAVRATSIMNCATISCIVLPSNGFCRSGKFTRIGTVSFWILSSRAGDSWPSGAMSMRISSA